MPFFRKGPVRLASTRRKFLRSLCRSALVLPFERVLTLALPVPRRRAWARTSVGASFENPRATPLASARPAQDLGVTFVDVARESGLTRSEERRVGKEWRARWWPAHK